MWLSFIQMFKIQRMGKSVKKVLKEEYDRLKKVMKNIVNPKKQDAIPSMVLQPVRQKKY